MGHGRHIPFAEPTLDLSADRLKESPLLQSHSAAQREGGKSQTKISSIHQ